MKTQKLEVHFPSMNFTITYKIWEFLPLIYGILINNDMWFTSKPKTTIYSLFVN